MDAQTELKKRNVLSEAFVKITASGFGAGYSPVASGTVGCVLPCVIWWYLPGGDPVKVITALAVLIASVPISTAAEKLFGKKDDSHIVIDEFIGMWISLLFLPQSIKYYAAAFVMFRVFDVIKPLGIRKIQNLKGGWGIVADDFLAGILANICVRAMAYAAGLL